MKSIALMCLFALTTLQCHAQLGTVYAPCSIHDSCGVVYSHKQDERCLLTFLKCERQDSLIVTQRQQLNRADSIMFDQQLKINDYEPELVRRRKNVFKAAIGGTVGGFFLGIAVFGIALLS
jgi:hypothetical protein